MQMHVTIVRVTLAVFRDTGHVRSVFRSLGSTKCAATRWTPLVSFAADGWIDLRTCSARQGASHTRPAGKIGHEVGWIHSAELSEINSAQVSWS
jgi:hypothetical protein